MIDTGAAPNLVKKSRLHPENSINPESTLFLSGITDGRVKTLGTTDVSHLGHKIQLQVVSDDFPIPQDGILGEASGWCIDLGRCTEGISCFAILCLSRGPDLVLWGSSVPEGSRYCKHSFRTFFRFYADY
ncbi:hypothetical protein X777_16587 [Ooceraea biroi]|uniref:Peptidase A2 domain-containing protein n=1 Tax=Ooceraea biroi TaxID=2015173 RepID=A0A026VTS5_OOCBI|nr:hypothetical protein X777_16587 [Ooceraea biroi]